MIAEGIIEPPRRNEETMQSMKELFSNLPKSRRKMYQQQHLKLGGLASISLVSRMLRISIPSTSWLVISLDPQISMIAWILTLFRELATIEVCIPVSFCSNSGRSKIPPFIMTELQKYQDFADQEFIHKNVFSYLSLCVQLYLPTLSNFINTQ